MFQWNLLIYVHHGKDCLSFRKKLLSKISAQQFAAVLKDEAVS